MVSFLIGLSSNLGLSGGANYTYNYDPNNSYSTNNFTTVSNYWNDLDDSTPLDDVSNAADAVEAATGTRPTILLMSKATLNLLKQNESIQNAILAQNVTANVYMTDNRVKELFSNELGINIIVYAKQYKDEAGNTKKFYPDGMVTLLPEGTLGTTFYGVTPEEHRSDKLDVSIVDSGIAVAVETKFDPVQTLTKVSEIVLPSFERMDETYMIKVLSSLSY